MSSRVIKEGDFIKLDFTGRIKDTGEIFDSTLESVAKSDGTYDKNKKYEPLIIAVGKGQVIKGLDKFLIGKEPGHYTVDIKPEEAFGKRNPKLMKLMSKQVFLKHNINPFPGLRVEMDNALATIVSVTGSRVLVDFNHPLAGKEVTYEIDIKGFVDDKKEQISVVVESVLGKKPEVVEKNGEFVLDFSKLDENMRKVVGLLQKEIKEEVKNKTGVDVKLEGTVDSSKEEKKEEPSDKEAKTQ